MSLKAARPAAPRPSRPRGGAPGQYVPAGQGHGQPLERGEGGDRREALGLLGRGLVLLRLV